MKSNAVVAPILLAGMFVAYSFSEPVASADGVFDFVSQPAATVAAAKNEPASQPEVRERTISVVQSITTKDVTALRQRLADVQAEHASLYTGKELVALIEQTEQAVIDRKAELVEKQKDFDSKLAAIRVQLEELRDTAAAVGADVSLEIMVSAAKQAKKADGRPTMKPPVGSTRSSNFAPNFSQPSFDEFVPNRSRGNDFELPVDHFKDQHNDTIDQF